MAKKIFDDDDAEPIKKPQSITRDEQAKIGDNKWIRVISSNVYAIKFMPANRQRKENLLLVRFWRRKKTQRHTRSRFVAKKMGPYYIYAGVPRAVWNNFVEAISKGGFVHLDLIGTYLHAGPF